VLKRAATDSAADREGDALKDLGRRVNRVKAWVAAVSVCGGLFVGVVGYIELRALQMELAGGHRPVVTGAVTIGIAFAIAAFAANRISRLVVRVRAPAWIEAARARHEVAADPLREFMAMWD
jgi:uncharacterized membrane protein (DUF485 family)